jgi:hypothetical protein
LFIPVDIDSIKKSLAEIYKINMILNQKNLRKLVIFILLCLPILFIGCKQTKTGPQEELTEQLTKQPTEENQTKEMPGQERTVIMLGRSVMEGWFAHWGWDHQNPIKKGRFTLEYHEISPPPDIVNSVKQTMDNLPAEKKDIIFFKFCFDDFEGDVDANSNLERNKKYIEEIHQIVVENHQAKLIIGNALPKVIKNTDIYLVWNHQQFNSWLNDLWKEHPENVTVFNMYDKLSNEMGALKKEFTDDLSDSHLNDRGYEALDESFFDILGNLY